MKKALKIVIGVALGLGIVMLILMLASHNNSEKDGKISSRTDTVNSAVVYPKKRSNPASDKGKSLDSSTVSESANSKVDVKTSKYTAAQTIIEESFHGAGGEFSYCFHDYSTDCQYGGDDRKMKSASIIKLFIMDYMYSLIQHGEISEDDIIGSQSVRALIESMITVSDNYATNVLIDYLSFEKINNYLNECGYTSTSLNRKMLDTRAAMEGKENYTSSADVMKLLDRLYEGRQSFPYNRMIEIMKKQKIATKLRRDMPSSIDIASKTGELSDVENDVAIVFAPKGDYAIVCLTQNADSSKARNAMAICNRRIYDELYTGSNLQ